jgi:hypothetical protein
MKYQALKTVAIFILVTTSAFAGLFHVSTGGQNTEEYSIAQNWDSDNYYQQISTVASMATMSDTILIDYGIYPYHNTYTQMAKQAVSCTYKCIFHNLDLRTNLHEKNHTIITDFSSTTC